MALLMGNLHQRNSQGVREELCMAVAHQKAWHIASIYGPGPGADADSCDATFLNMGKQPVG